jgi:hypothetical protein
MEEDIFTGAARDKAIAARRVVPFQPADVLTVSGSIWTVSGIKSSCSALGAADRFGARRGRSGCIAQL